LSSSRFGVGMRSGGEAGGERTGVAGRVSWRRFGRRTVVVVDDDEEPLSLPLPPDQAQHRMPAMKGSRALKPAVKPA
jgi:hypothetical protein